MTPVVSFENVSKEFIHEGGKTVRAVDRLSLEIGKGEIFSLVGPDGAGKTTSIRMMCGVLPPTEGEIRVLGFNIRTDREAIKPRIGYLSQRFSLYGDLTINENIDFFAEIHRLRNYQERKEELLQFTRLTAFRDRLADRLSGGMKQKLALACTLIHTPDLIFLDEPTTGVDPVSRRDFWKILSAVLKSGVTIVMSTPYLDEAERCTRVALMNEGKLLLCDTPDQVRRTFPFEVIEMVCDDPRRAVEVLKRSNDIERAELFGDRIHLIVERWKTAERPITLLLHKERVEVLSVRPKMASLEDVFISQMSA
jgi:ABC-2 type transport system ATP-binding protein